MKSKGVGAAKVVVLCGGPLLLLLALPVIQRLQVSRAEHGAQQTQRQRRSQARAATVELLRVVGNGQSNLSLRSVNELALHGADLNAQQVDSGDTSLSTAIVRGDLAMARTLLGLGADVEARNRFGDTALMRAIGAQDVAAVQLLLSQGAQVNTRLRMKDFKATPLEAAQGKFPTMPSRWRRNFVADSRAKKMQALLKAAGAKA